MAQVKVLDAPQVVTPTGSRIWSAIKRAFLISMEANSRQETVRKLQAKTDDELRDIGIRRDDIVRHVYADMYYI